MAEGWGEAGPEMWREREREELGSIFSSGPVCASVCQWRNWIAPPDNDKVAAHVQNRF